MTRSILLGAVAFATLAAVPSLPAQAQGDATIVIEGPRVERVRQPGSFGTEEVVTASSVVFYDDLALNTEYGREILKDRVKIAAKETCDLLEDVYPVGRSLSSEFQCVRKAVNGARDQVNAAIARYGYG
jgi:UrcA family protein